MAHTRTVPSFEDDAKRGADAFLKGTGGQRIQDADVEINLHVYWFPSKRRDPFCVSLQSVT